MYPTGLAGPGWLGRGRRRGTCGIEWRLPEWIAEDRLFSSPSRPRVFALAFELRPSCRVLFSLIFSLRATSFLRDFKITPIQTLTLPAHGEELL